MEVTEQDLEVGNEKKVAVYRVVQEATSNAIRHANAQTIEVMLSARDHHLCVIIRDDGVGFDTKANEKVGGTANMERRVREVGGFFTITSGSNGTEVSMEI